MGVPLVVDRFDDDELDGLGLFLVLGLVAARGGDHGQQGEQDKGMGGLRQNQQALREQLRKLLDELKLYRPGLGFYALRHTFETVAGGSKDQIAVNAIMGHVDASMAAIYRERIDDDRLRAVTDHVHNWLFSGEVSP